MHHWSAQFDAVNYKLEKIMTTVNDIAAAVTAISGIVAQVNTTVTDLLTEAVPAIQAEIAALGTPVDTSALDAAVAALTPLAAQLSSAQAAVDALEPPAAS